MPHWNRKNRQNSLPGQRRNNWSWLKLPLLSPPAFCFGVDRAVKLCYQALEEHHNIATLGPIIHNQDVVDDLTRRGARIVDSIAELHPDECVVIRSHGVSAKVYEELEQAGNPYVDATCPFVAKIHRIVEKHTKAGDFILIAGDANHPEVAAIVGHCKGNCFVFESEKALNDFFQKKFSGFSQKTCNCCANNV